MKRVLFLIMLLMYFGAMAQEDGTQYRTALGVKISSGVAVSYKTFVTSKNALEAQSTFFHQGIRLVALYEFHSFAFQNIPNLSWYIGPGAHTGYWKKNYRDKYNSTLDVGIDGVLGLDYKVPKVPINLSLDWQPSYSILGNAGLSPQFGGIAVRWVLN